MSTVDVDTEAIRAHATALDALATDLAEAIAAGKQTAMGDEAFGIFCQFLVPDMNSIQLDGIAGLGTAATALDEIRSSLRATAACYDETDLSVKTSLTAMVPRPDDSTIWIPM